jgi:3-isopropylmalate/(R)-2-methylmalate dehydratase large subunit
MDGGQYQAVQYAGEAVGALPMQERMTLANMTAELGGQAGLVAPDAVTAEWLRGVGVVDVEIDRWQTDPGAPLAEHHRFDASTLAPQVAAPHSPANSANVSEFAHQRIDIAYIGACTGAKLDDLRMAARVLKGRRAASHVRMMVAPASLKDQETARAEGTLGALLDAGAELLPTACGACAGYGDFRFGEDTVAISTTARNFRGRMGAASSQVYLGSPYTVAAAAVAGEIVDPRELL